MPKEKKPDNPAADSRKGVSVDSEVISIAVDDDPGYFSSGAQSLGPAASAMGEGGDSNTMNLYTLDFTASCVSNSPVGDFRFVESSPAGRPLAQIASHNPTQVRLENDPQNHAHTDWRDVAVKISSGTTKHCMASLYISDIPGTGCIQASLLATRPDTNGDASGDTRPDEVVYCFSGVLRGRLNVSGPASCRDPGPSPHAPCHDPHHDPHNNPCKDTSVRA